MRREGYQAPPVWDERDCETLAVRKELHRHVCALHCVTLKLVEDKIMLEEERQRRVKRVSLMCNKSSLSRG